jgi:hypothetical protein
MYKETLTSKDLVNKPKVSQHQINSKVNRICDAFLAVLEQPRYRDEHLQNMITSHVSKVPPALEAGLEMIGRLQGNHYQVYSYTLGSLTWWQHLKTRSQTKQLSTYPSSLMSTNFMIHHWDFTI